MFLSLMFAIISKTRKLWKSSNSKWIFKTFDTPYKFLTGYKKPFITKYWRTQLRGSLHAFVILPVLTPFFLFLSAWHTYGEFKSKKIRSQSRFWTIKTFLRDGRRIQLNKLLVSYGLHSISVLLTVGSLYLCEKGGRQSRRVLRCLPVCRCNHKKHQSRILLEATGL